MYTLRCTKSLLERLGEPITSSEDPTPDPTTVLGDWYANLLNVGHRRLILCTNERSLLSLVVPARDLRGLPHRLAESVAALLERIGVPPPIVAREVREMQWARFDRTLSRKVLGSMNDFAIGAALFFRGNDAADALEELDWELNGTPCGPLKYAFPRERAKELLLGAA